MADAGRQCQMSVDPDSREVETIVSTVVARRPGARFAPLPPFRAVVMDMDGLALDTEATYCEAWRNAASDLGFCLTIEFCRSLFGRHADDVKSALCEACQHRLDLAAFHALADRHWRRALATTGVARMPGLDRLLTTLRARRLPYALATNSDQPYAGLCLEAGRVLADFPVIVTRDQVAKGKPEPDLFLEAARRLGVPAAECLVLEDSMTGLAAGIAAGMIPLWIPPPHGTAVAPAAGVRVLPDLAVVADLIALVPA